MSAGAAVTERRERFAERLRKREVQLTTLRAEIEQQEIPPEALAEAQRSLDVAAATLAAAGIRPGAFGPGRTAVDVAQETRLRKAIAERWAEKERYGWDMCPSCNAGRLGGAHCVTCHSNDHNACDECGACLGASGLGNRRWFGGEYMGGGCETRSDRYFCSNACRQRAYRRRRSEAAEASGSREPQPIAGARSAA
jgi:ferredoxin